MASTHTLFLYGNLVFKGGKQTPIALCCKVKSNSLGVELGWTDCCCNLITF